MNRSMRRKPVQRVLYRIIQRDEQSHTILARHVLPMTSGERALQRPEQIERDAWIAVLHCQECLHGAKFAQRDHIANIRIREQGRRLRAQARQVSQIAQRAS